MRVYHKAYVYLTCGTDLLVFDEPDTPHLGLQVPGGTIDPGESFLHGAMREFAEETGLELDVAFDHFSSQDIPFETIPPVGQYRPAPNRPLLGPTHPSQLPCPPWCPAEERVGTLRNASQQRRRSDSLPFLLG